VFINISQFTRQVRKTEYHAVQDRSTRNGIAGRLRNKCRKQGTRGTTDDLNISSHEEIKGSDDYV